MKKSRRVGGRFASQATKGERLLAAVRAVGARNELAGSGCKPHQVGSFREETARFSLWRETGGGGYGGGWGVRGGGGGGLGGEERREEG